MVTAPTHLLTDPERRNVAQWNVWRTENPLGGANLRGADLGGADLGGADLGGANLGGADLRGADLGGADLWGADLWGADLGGANLRYADLGGADLRYADLGGADLRGANLRGANLQGANLQGAVGARRADICAAVPVGSGELCSAMRNDDGTIRIWAGGETFGSIKECRERIMELGGEHEAERLAWLKWVKARLAVQP